MKVSFFKIIFPLFNAMPFFFCWSSAPKCFSVPFLYFCGLHFGHFHGTFELTAHVGIEAQQAMVLIHTQCLPTLRIWINSDEAGMTSTPLMEGQWSPSTKGNCFFSIT